jgi:MYXO-CTERM domain-containing protein
MRLFVLVLALALTIVGTASARPLTAVEADRARISAHLERVERELRHKPVSELSPALRAERAKNLDRLRTYRLAGEFPHNTRHPDERVPYFIDDDGRACAVGALMLASGGEAVASTIRRDENNARLLEMKTPGISAWVARSGLTAEEHAQIQPSYCFDGGFSMDCMGDTQVVCGKSGKTYDCRAVLENCSDDEYAYDGPCDGRPDDTEPDEDSEGCALGGGDPRNASLVFVLLALGALGARRRRPLRS